MDGVVMWTSAVLDKSTKEIKMSPTPKKAVSVEQELTFGEAMVAVANGQQSRRPEWPEEDYLFLRMGRVHIHKSDGDHQFALGDGDILNDDWIARRVG
jgi:hypothetical protein